MASGFTPKWKRPFLKTPFYKKCPAGNYHFFTDKYCSCSVGEYCGTWNGGVFVFKTNQEISYEAFLGLVAK